MYTFELYGKGVKLHCRTLYRGKESCGFLTLQVTKFRAVAHSDRTWSSCIVWFTFGFRTNYYGGTISSIRSRYVVHSNSHKSTLGNLVHCSYYRSLISTSFWSRSSQRRSLTHCCYVLTNVENAQVWTKWQGRNRSKCLLDEAYEKPLRRRWRWYEADHCKSVGEWNWPSREWLRPPAVEWIRCITSYVKGIHHKVFLVGLFLVGLSHCHGMVEERLEGKRS